MPRKRTIAKPVDPALERANAASIAALQALGANWRERRRLRLLDLAERDPDLTPSEARELEHLTIEHRLRRRYDRRRADAADTAEAAWRERVETRPQWVAKRLDRYRAEGWPGLDRPWLVWMLERQQRLDRREDAERRQLCDAWDTEHPDLVPAAVLTDPAPLRPRTRAEPTPPTEPTPAPRKRRRRATITYLTP